MKSTNIVFVHGLLGWGPKELGEIPYWGQALEQFKDDFSVHEASCGPVSSFHDRACEVFAQIKGTKVDYGEQHSKDEHHSRYSDNFTGNAFVANWSEENPVILIGHSAGAQTCMQLQQLLAEHYWNCGSNARWIEAIVCIAGVINGSTLPYMLGCDKHTGLLSGSVGNFIGNAVQIVAMAAGGSVENIYDFDLDQWVGEGKTGNYKALIAALDNSHFAKGEENLGFDLSLQGGLKANQKFRTDRDTYYLSIVTGQTRKGWLTNNQFPELRMNPLLGASAFYQGVTVDFDQPPIPGWGSGDLTIEKWKENDGAVSSVSQRYPFTAGSHPVGGEGIFGRETVERGKWYYEKAEKSTGRSFDHLDVVFGCFSEPTIIEAHKAIYKNLCTFLRNLR